MLASLVSLAAVFGPLFFSFAYYGVRGSWPGLVWIIGATIYLLALPLMLGIRARAGATVPPEPRQS